jgi:hypothetical protein
MTESPAGTSAADDHRTVPKRRLSASIVFHGVFVPLNWVLTRLGFESALVTLMNRAQSGGRFEKVFQGYEPRPVTCS